MEETIINEIYSAYRTPPDVRAAECLFAQGIREADLTLVRDKVTAQTGSVRFVTVQNALRDIEVRMGLK